MQDENTIKLLLLHRLIEFRYFELYESGTAKAAKSTNFNIREGARPKNDSHHFFVCEGDSLTSF